LYLVYLFNTFSFFITGQLVAYTYEEVGIRVCSLLDDELPIIEIPTPVRLFRY